MDEAIKYQRERRMQSVPKKFRAPENTDAELKKEETKRKKKDKLVQKADTAKATLKNSDYLADALKLPEVSPEENDITKRCAKVPYAVNKNVSRSLAYGNENSQMAVDPIGNKSWNYMKYIRFLFCPYIRNKIKFDLSICQLTRLKS